MAVSADGRLMLAGTWGDSKRKNLRLWRIDTAEELWVFPGQDTALQSVALSPDLRWAASGGYDGSVRLWRIPDRFTGPEARAGPARNER
jgi:WD40 repeat protein